MNEGNSSRKNVVNVKDCRGVKYPYQHTHTHTPSHTHCYDTIIWRQKKKHVNNTTAHQSGCLCPLHFVDSSDNDPSEDIIMIVTVC